MANTVSVQQAATDALVAWIAGELADVVVSNEWPDAGQPLPPQGAVTVLRAGQLDATPVRPPTVMRQVDDPPPAVTSTFTFLTHSCEQPMQLDVWATSKPRRDDIINRLGDALTASKRRTLAGFLAATGGSLNQDAVEQAIVLQLAPPWDHLNASYLFDEPEIEDDAASSKRREFRGTYRGTAYFDRTVTRNLPRIARVLVPVAATPAGGPVPAGTTPTLVVTPSGTTLTRT